MRMKKRRRGKQETGGEVQPEVLLYPWSRECLAWNTPPVQIGLSLSLSSCWVTKSKVTLGANGERGRGPKKAQLFRLQTSELALLTHVLLNPLSRPKKTRTVSSWTKEEKKKEFGRKKKPPEVQSRKRKKWSLGHQLTRSTWVVSINRNDVQPQDQSHRR